MAAPDIVQAMTVRYGAESFELGVQVPAGSLLEALRDLRDHHGYRYYVTGTGADRTDLEEPAFEVVHGVRNLETNDTMWVRVRLPKEGAEVDSAAFVYAGAEWHEREILDLFGITFRSHPDPRRILMPDEYEGHPLRKDFAMDTPWGYRPATSGEESA